MPEIPANEEMWMRADMLGNEEAKAQDVFQNIAARTGWGAPNLENGASYPLSRFSFDYWGLISRYEDNWIYRRIVDAVAEDMVRNWPSVVADIDPVDLDRVESVLRRTLTRSSYLTGLKWGRLFGGAGCLIAIRGHEERLDTPLRVEDVGPGSFLGLIPFDMWAGIQPDPGSISESFDDPENANRPQFYTVQFSGKPSFRVHASRILRHVGLENPTPERETYMWWGISVLTPVFQEIQRRDNVAANIAGLTFRANLLAMRDPELAERMSGLGSSARATQQYQARMSEINRMMSNESLLLLGRDGALESTQYGFAGLSECYQQFQLDISGAAEISVSRLWGKTITGLGQSNDADERMYEEKIMRDQATYMAPGLESKLYPVLFMSALGEIPKGFKLVFPSIRVLSETEKVELARSTADASAVALNSGVMSPRAFARELQKVSGRTGIFTNITDEDIAKLSNDVLPQPGGMGLFGMEEGAPNLSESSSPQKVLREKGREEIAEAQDADFVEGEHPQDEGGKFSEKPSSSSSLKAYSSRDEWPDHSSGDVGVRSARRGRGMIPYIQTRTGNDGNCLETALAAILETEVPDFGLGVSDDEHHRLLTEWLRQHGRRLRYFGTGIRPHGYHIIEGISPRGGRHAVVGYRGKIVHDPHPVDGTGRGLKTVERFGVVLPERA